MKDVGRQTYISISFFQERKKATYLLMADGKSRMKISTAKSYPKAIVLQQDSLAMHFLQDLRLNTIQF